MNKAFQHNHLNLIIIFRKNKIIKIIKLVCSSGLSDINKKILLNEPVKLYFHAYKTFELKQLRKLDELCKYGIFSKNVKKY